MGSISPGFTEELWISAEAEAVEDEAKTLLLLEENLPLPLIKKLELARTRLDPKVGVA